MNASSEAFGRFLSELPASAQDAVEGSSEPAEDMVKQALQFMIEAYVVRAVIVH
jgi:hypothetical protein